MEKSVHWASVIAVVLLSWLAVTLAVCTLVGHGITLGTRNESR